MHRGTGVLTLRTASGPRHMKGRRLQTETDCRGSNWPSSFIILYLKSRGIERASICKFTSQNVDTRGQSQEPGTQPSSPPGVAGTQTLESLPAASQVCIRRKLELGEAHPQGGTEHHSCVLTQEGIRAGRARDWTHVAAMDMLYLVTFSNFSGSSQRHLTMN